MQTFKQRIKRILPYFASSRAGIVVAILASIVGAATEPVLPALMQPLLDKGFQAGGIPLWLVPIVIIGLFTVRGAAVFIAKYSLSWAANGGILVMRAAMFEHLLAAQPTLFTRHSASSLTNTLVYEVQGGANQLVHSVLGLVRDSLTLVAMLSYLLWLNWKLTLFVAVLIPSVGVVMRVLSKRLHRLTVAGQTATDQLAYVVEENVLAWRIVRLHGAAAERNRALRQEQRGDAPAGDEIGRRGVDDDAGDADPRRLRDVGGDRRRTLAEHDGGHVGRRIRLVRYRDVDGHHADQEPVRGRSADHARAGVDRTRREADRRKPARNRRRPRPGPGARRVRIARRDAALQGRSVRCRARSGDA